MANVFTRKTQRAIGTSTTAIESYTPAGGVVATVIGLSVANIDANNNIQVDVELYDGANTTYLMKNAPVPIGGAIVVVGGDQKLVLTNGDYVRVTSDTESSVDAVLSVLEIS